jgi:hypothetical protein
MVWAKRREWDGVAESGTDQVDESK